MKFLYQPLELNEIRLLKPVYTTTHTVAFDLIHASLLLTPQYTALSYTWGSPGEDQDILLNGQRFPIRRNLHDALRQMRSSKIHDRYLWVDAICIDQGGDSQALGERSAQITLMKDIYERATKVLVWLGHPENEANNRLAFQMMNRLEGRQRNVEKKDHLLEPWRWRPQKAGTPGEENAKFMRSISPATDKTILDEPGTCVHRAWLGIAALWNHPYWTRTWVFQESTIPERNTNFGVRGLHIFRLPRKLKFLCGNQMACWPDIYATVVVAFMVLATPGMKTDFLAGPAAIIQRLGVFRIQRVRFKSLSFLDVLQKFRHTKCLDLRDKVYAPLCLAFDEIRRPIKPDYVSKTVGDVYTDVVRYFLAQPDYNLEFLGYTMYQEEVQVVQTADDVYADLPSWVPNFSRNLDIVPIPTTLFLPQDEKRSDPSGQAGATSAFRALGDLESRSFIDERALCVSGVYIDVVKDIIPYTGPSPEVIDTVSRNKGYQWAFEAKGEYFTGESFKDAISRTVVLDLIYDTEGRPSKRGGRNEFAFREKPREELSLPQYWTQTTMGFALKQASALRDLALSEKHYLLLTPRSAMVGDLVWALAGGQVLYVLRSVDHMMKQYKFIGECYAHGLMDGEIVRRLEQGEMKLEDLSLI
ncbi:MAG: hypothetical protein Q9220_007554 [cf. Caloplaca sp. 1 TL-2023]